MTINIRFDWEKDNFLSKMRDMKWIIMQVLLKDIIWVAYGTITGWANAIFGQDSYGRSWHMKYSELQLLWMESMDFALTAEK